MYSVYVDTLKPSELYQLCKILACVYFCNTPSYFRLKWVILITMQHMKYWWTPGYISQTRVILIQIKTDFWELCCSPTRVWVWFTQRCSFYTVVLASGIHYLSFWTSPAGCSCFSLRLESNISFNMMPQPTKAFWTFTRDANIWPTRFSNIHGSTRNTMVRLALGQTSAHRSTNTAHKRSSPDKGLVRDLVVERSARTEPGDLSLTYILGYKGCCFIIVHKLIIIGR